MSAEALRSSLPYRRLRLSIATETAEVVIELGEEEWRRILSGEELVLAGQGYVYEGVAFNDVWHFNGRGPLTLEIGYDGAGVAFDGPLNEAVIERYDPVKAEYNCLPVLCLEFDSSGEMPIDIFEWAGLELSDPEISEATDRVWDQHNPQPLFGMMPSALVEELDEVGESPPGSDFVRTQAWSRDCLLLKAELRLFLGAHLATPWP
jgi:hypothetical protein